MNQIMKLIYYYCEIIRKGFSKMALVPGLKASLRNCGKNVRIAYDCDLKPPCNIFIGDNSQIGRIPCFGPLVQKLELETMSCSLQM